ncbi:MAG: PAS domain S-box protein, partial [Nitrospirae bacterium]|nr:PAS domain S-box protein [Nitrospirota bacterium]
RVYQIELEMQNDELRLAQEELEANLTGAALLGCARSRLIKKPFSIFIDRDYREMFHLHCKDVFDASDRQTSEIKIRKKDGSVFYAQMESIRVEDPQGKKSCRSSVIDITGRKQAEEALKKVYDELETRIEARTSELKRTNERLLKEAAERKQTEKALRVSRNKLRSMYDTITKSEQAYKTLIKNIPGLVYRVHTRENNRIQFFNKASETLTGYKDHELSCGEICSIESCMYPEDRPKVIGVLKDAIAAGLPFSVEYRFTHKDGCIKYFIENGIPIKDVDGKLLYIDGIILDITRRRQAEEELRKFKFISDQSNDAHFLTDRDARFRYVNKSACRMLGYTEDELLSLSVPDVDIVYDLEKYRQLFDLTQRENVMPIETLNKRKDGSVFPAEITLN